MSDLPKGLFAKKPNANAPSFVKSKLSIKREDFLNYLKDIPDEWINFDIKESKDGSKYYVQRDDWKPTPSAPKPDEISDENIPF